MNTLAAAVETLTAAIALGSIVWFFFVQTPVLLRRMGRDRFVPLQLSLAPPLFKTTLVLMTLTVASAWAAGAHESLLISGAAWLVSLGLVLVVVPRAVRAGGASLSESLEGGAQRSVTRFTADGGGEATKVWHRVLGLASVLVVLLLGAQLVRPALHHAGAPPTASAHVHQPAPAPVTSTRWKANPETIEGVHAMRSLVKRARSNELSTGEAASELRMAFGEIFSKCTMTGAAHEALHGFLLPIGSSLDALEAAKTRDEAEAILLRLEAQLGTFERDFD